MGGLLGAMSSEPHHNTGALAAADLNADPLSPGEHESLDPIVGTWRIFQLKRGHRFSVDDMVTAWLGARARPEARRLLDLGCGIGSVGLSTLWRVGHADATLLGVEAQEVSVGLARRTFAYNGVADRVSVVLGDLRDPDVVPGGQTFELITGSPPYIPPGKGLLSPHPQRAHCRIELRGSVYDYCVAAKRFLAPAGRFAFVMLAADPRTEDAPVAAGLRVVERLDVVFRAGREPQIAVLVCAHADEILSDAVRATSTMTVRDAAGEFTDDYNRFRLDMGGMGPLASRNASASC